MGYILSIDQGTTSSRAVVFDQDMQKVSSAQAEFTQYFPQPGWVEHDPEEIWQSVLSTSREAIAKAGIDAAEIAGIGITNQRETVVIWDRETGQPIHKAIVWQDRRTADHCAALKEAGHEPMVQERTGLLLDPYFSGTKVAWLLDQVEGARAQAEAGKLAFGTIDTFLIWRLTGGASHFTDATNASRTLLYDIRNAGWDTELCALLNVPMGLLPEVKNCADEFGATDPEHFGAAIPIYGVAGDQHAATLGQACFSPGMLKATYGTGCFALLNTGDTLVRSENRLLTTIAYQFEGKPTYALEGSIFMAGATVQWLRDNLGIISDASETQALAETAHAYDDVYLVPAFVGLGAPHWNSEARAAIVGLSRGSGKAELAKAALEAVGYQTLDLLEAMSRDGAPIDGVIRVDGGMSASDWTMQFLSDIANQPVDRPTDLETTVKGAAWLAGVKAGLYPAAEVFADSWQAEQRFMPNMDAEQRDAKCSGWQNAVKQVLS